MHSKMTLKALLLTASLFAPTMVSAQLSPTASNDIYTFDTTKFDNVKLMQLFEAALEQGRKYPTPEEFEAAGIHPSDIAFIRSHVRRAQILDRADRLVPGTYENRNLWMNIPMSTGKDMSVGQPSSTFSDDVYSMWNYTNLFGSWNKGFFQAPGAWVDAAHKNGTTIMSGIMFFDTTGGRQEGATGWIDIISEKNSDGTFRYVKPLINCLMYFGADGINYNWEATGFTDDDVIAFNKALFKEAEANGFADYKMGLYTSYSGLTAGNVNALFGNEEGRTATTMLNYSGGDFSYTMGPSVTAAETAMGTSEDLYAGCWIVTMDRGWSRLDATDAAHRCGLCLWGEHNTSRFWSYNSGNDAYEQQSNYQYLLERAFSGGNRNPLNRPAVSDTGNNWEKDGDKLPLSTFAGLATWIPERSAIQGNLPFATFFNLGNGDRYLYKGKKTAGSWYNMGNQDRVPTYRWLVTEAGTQTASDKIFPEFSHDDAYTGGSCLKLTGEATAAGTDIVLFKTKLTAGAGVYANVAFKNGVEGSKETCLYVILQKKDGSIVEVPVGASEGKTWQEKKLNVSGVAQGDEIVRIGLRVKGNDNAYKLYVGKLEINDESKVVPAGVKDLTVEVKEETKSSLSIKANWLVEQAAGDRAAWDLLYNDEANIDHFEILYKNGEEGKVSEIGRTTQWATYVGNIDFESVDDKPFIGVRSVSTDLKTYSPVEWVEVARAPQDQLEKREVTTYGISQMDPNCEGAEIAREQRYVTLLTTTGATTNLNYTADAPQADGTQYVHVTDQTLVVNQGQDVTITIKCADFSDGLKYCFAGGWMDLDQSGTFNPDPIDENPAYGERLFKVGNTRAATPEFQTTGIVHTFKVPEDARPGASRLRIVFSDAWFAGQFLPTGLHAKGFSIDFDVEITGTNTPRDLPADSHDAGEADEPEGLNAESGVSTSLAAVSSFQVVGETVLFNNVEKAWIYDAKGSLVKYVINPASVNVADLANGVYLVRMQNGRVLRTGKFVK